MVPSPLPERPSILDLASDAMLGHAYDWVCSQRREHGHNNSIWDLRFNWGVIKPKLQQQLLKNTDALSPVQSYFIQDEWISSWSALDSLILKALTITLQPLFSHASYPQCTHLKNAGGIHSAIKQVSCNQENYQHILKSDAYHNYESIDHQVLLSALATQISCPVLLSILSQYCQRLEIKDGNYYHFTRGIPMGCPLSPLMAAIYLKPLDDALMKHGFYVRFMDDWVVMVKTNTNCAKSLN